MTDIWRRLYEATLRAAAHRHAEWYLALLSFSESSFFPIPPDVMLAPMSLAKPQRAWRFAAITTVTSVAGGLLGYAIGFYALGFAQSWLENIGHWQDFLAVREWFAEWGFWAILLAGFSPIPYKVFTVAAGAGAMALLPFVLASALGRGARFFLVAGLVRSFGPAVEQRMIKYIDVIGWVLVAIIVVAIAGYQLL